MITLDKEHEFYFLTWSTIEQNEMDAVVDRLDWISQDHADGTLGFNAVCAVELAGVVKQLHDVAVERNALETGLTYARVYAQLRKYKELNLPPIVSN
ncbi:MAG: hypothetical protein HRT61_01100 [Ekhidna sp.]|nr:hypothetical protein [Ekhidna sp.]